ncbi:hypothetical protein K439DRAFT_1615800 [Ramaria rubella]|nr:hypothetical protein K439DRAFT_1615800 [Ramaria rubella]
MPLKDSFTSEGKHAQRCSIIPASKSSSVQLKTNSQARHAPPKQNASSSKITQGTSDAEDSSQSYSDASIHRSPAKKAKIDKPGFDMPFAVSCPALVPHPMLEMGNKTSGSESQSRTFINHSQGKENPIIAQNEGILSYAAKEHADVTAQLKLSVIRLEKLVNEPGCVLELLKYDLNDIVERVVVLDEGMAGFQEEMVDGEVTLKDMKRSIEELQREVGELREELKMAHLQGSDPEFHIDPDNGGSVIGTKGPKARNNQLAATVHCTLLTLMDVSKSTKLPKPLKNGFWAADVTDPDEQGEALLCLQWHLNIKENEEWIPHAANIIKRDGRSYNKKIKKKDLEDTDLQDICAAIWTTFGSWAKAWKTKKKSHDEQSVEKQCNRCKKRGRDKCHECRLVHDSVPKAAAAEWDFLFEPAYQSADETAADEIGSDTDEESDAEVPKAKVHGPWRYVCMTFYKLDKK